MAFPMPQIIGKSQLARFRGFFHELDFFRIFRATTVGGRGLPVVPESPGVLLPGDSARVQLISVAGLHRIVASFGHTNCVLVK